MKEQKELLCSRIGELEEQFKLFCRAQADPRAWISAETLRIRLTQCAGRRTLDKDLLYAALSRLLDEDSALAVLEAGYKEGKAFERLLAGSINE